ncbi:phage major capsid protein, partial [Streptomyces sp. A73]|nr:phage major capsid protein [Streptomyces sp. A73]
LVGPIFEKSVEGSAVMSLARRVPLSMTATTAGPVPLDVPPADWVAEGGRKPLSSGGVAVKLMSGKKIATLIP